MTTAARSEPLASRVLAQLRVPVTKRPSTAIMVATEVLAILGLGIATYLTYVHFTSVANLSCPRTVFNCTKVTTSGESRFFGLPVSVLGLFQYTVMVGLCSPWAWRSTQRLVHLARLAFAVVGMAFVIWLISAEALIIKAICEWCTGVHVVTFVMFICVIRSVPELLGWTSSES